MNQSDRSDPAGQSADLRTRIAAAIYDGMNEWDRKYAIDPRNSALTPELKAEITCFKLADAVIRELELERENWHVDMGVSTLPRHMWVKPPPVHRYVTEWESR